MKTIFRVAVLLLFCCWLIPTASAQEGRRYPTFRDLTPAERLHYNERPADILPDAKAAFDKGNYERSIMLCSMHWAYYGDETSKLTERKQLEAQSKKCYDWSQEMNDLFSKGKVSDAKQKAREILEINALDPTAREIWNSPIKVTGVEVSPGTQAVKEGETVQLTAKVLPADASNKLVVWVSGDNSIATVSHSGLVKALKPGRVVITVVTKDGDFTGTCVLTVTALPKPEPKQEPKEEPKVETKKEQKAEQKIEPKPEPKPEPQPVKVSGIEISRKTLSLEKGKTWLLSAKVRPDDAANKSVFWTSSDFTVATVNYTGYVSAVGVGTATIKVTSADGNWADSCTVVVTAAPEPEKQVKEAAASEKKVKPAPQPVKPAIMVAPTVGIVPGLSYGLMAGYVGKIGVYGKFRSNFVSTGSTYDCTSDGKAGTDYIWTSGNTKVSLMSATAGVLYPIGKSVYPYVGVGYAKRELAWEDVDGEWARVKDASVAGLGLEGGVMLRFGMFGIHAGVNTAGFKYLGADAGIALFF